LHTLRVDSVPVLTLAGAAVLIFGQDHPAGKWSERHNLPATTLAAQQGHEVICDDDNSSNKNTKDSEAVATLHPAREEEATLVQPPVDVATNESLTMRTMIKILLNPLTWLPALAYLTTFGVELTIDNAMAGVLFSLYNRKQPGFTQTTAGYYTSIFGFLNIVTRPLGGYFGDVLYRSFGTKAKKIWMLLCGFIMSITLIVGGFYLQRHRVFGNAELTVLMGVFSISAIFSEIGNGANFALVPHCNSYNNGVMSGLVGSCGNLGGVIFSLVFRFQPQAGKAFWITGIICLAINALLFAIPVPTL